MSQAYVAKVNVPGFSREQWFYFDSPESRKAFVETHKHVAKSRRGKPLMVMHSAFERTQMNIKYYFG